MEPDAAVDPTTASTAPDSGAKGVLAKGHSITVTGHWSAVAGAPSAPEQAAHRFRFARASLALKGAQPSGQVGDKALQVLQLANLPS